MGAILFGQKGERGGFHGGGIWSIFDWNDIAYFLLYWISPPLLVGDLNGSRGDHFYTHANNFDELNDIPLPPFGQAASALVEGLRERGRLDETLVVMLTDFGRTPKINGGVGQDHFLGGYSAVFAGGGIQRGQVYGKSNPTGFEPAGKACGPTDLHATIFHALGVNPENMIYDTKDRPLPICDGKPLPLF